MSKESVIAKIDKLIKEVESGREVCIVDLNDEGITLHIKAPESYSLLLPLLCELRNIQVLHASREG